MRQIGESERQALVRTLVSSTSLDDTNLSEALKIELLQTLWSIMSAFVDLAFGTDPVQQTLPSLAAGQHDGPTGSAATPAERE